MSSHLLRFGADIPAFDPRERALQAAINDALADWLQDTRHSRQLVIASLRMLAAMNDALPLGRAAGHLAELLDAIERVEADHA